MSGSQMYLSADGVGTLFWAGVEVVMEQQTGVLDFEILVCLQAGF